MLWVLIRSTSQRRIERVPTTYVFMEKYYLGTPLIDLEQWVSTRKKAQLRMNIFFTSRLLVDVQQLDKSTSNGRCIRFVFIIIIYYRKSCT